MHVVGHNDRCLEIDSLPVVVHAVRQNEIARRVRERIADELTESHKRGTPCQLVMWHTAAVFVFVGEDSGVDHTPFKGEPRELSVTPEHSKCSFVGRTLLSAALEVDFDLEVGSDFDFRKWEGSKSTPKSTAAVKSVRP